MSWEQVSFWWPGRTESLQTAAWTIWFDRSGPSSETPGSHETKQSGRASNPSPAYHARLECTPMNSSRITGTSPERRSCRRPRIDDIPRTGWSCSFFRDLRDGIPRRFCRRMRRKRFKGMREVGSGVGTDDGIRLPGSYSKKWGKGPEGPVCCGYWTVVPSIITVRCAASMLFLLAQILDPVFFPGAKPFTVMFLIVRV